RHERILITSTGVDVYAAKKISAMPENPTVLLRCLSVRGRAGSCGGPRGCPGVVHGDEPEPVGPIAGAIASRRWSRGRRRGHRASVPGGGLSFGIGAAGRPGRR